MKLLSERLSAVRIWADQIRIILKKHNHSPEFAFDIAGKYIIWVHINTPEEFILKKLYKTNYTWGLFDNAEEAIQNYYDRKPLHRNINFPFSYTFDLSRSDFPAQIEESAEKIKKDLQS
ncbi:MAG TPA: hypothetical protein VJI70_04195 [Candidatus Paceibacterota bacterium]